MGEALLVIDTATDRTVLALRADPGARVRDGSGAGPERGATQLGSRLVALLAASGVSLTEIGAIGVGTGPGSFTGLRVGLATAKTLAWSLGVPLVGIPTIDALRRAAATPPTSPAAVVVVQGAGARDHYLALPGKAPRLVPPGTDLVAAIAGQPTIALGADAARLGDVRGPDGADPLAAGARAQDGLAVALLELLDERLGADRADDPATLVPVYVALPRGIAAGAGAGWTPEDPMRLRVEPMTVADIPAVHEIERLSFPVPWPAYAFRQELETNKLARYLVVREGSRTVAYGGIWLMVDEAHVTTFAVLPDWRRNGIGALLMLALMDLSKEVGAAVLTLEVRLSNIPARTLYQRFGFRPVGVRPRYYSDNGEDALIMTTDPITSPQMEARMAAMRARIEGRGGPAERGDANAATPERESLQ